MIWQMIIAPAWEGSFGNDKYSCPKCGTPRPPEGPIPEIEDHPW